MATLNKVFLLGNLTRDPDLRGLPSGQSVCEMRLAISRRYVSNGKEVDETCFVDVVVWGKSANNCKQFLTKGSQVMVEGRLQLDQWEDRNGGGQRSKLRVVAEQIQFMNRRPPEGGYPPRDGNAPYGSRDNGSSYGSSYGNSSSYGSRENNAYGDGDGNYGRPDSGYDSYNRSVNPPPMPAPRDNGGAAMPPLPEQQGGDGTQLVDDIPF